MSHVAARPLAPAMRRPLVMRSSTQAESLMTPIGGDATLLIVEDDEMLAGRLAQAMNERGFVVATVNSVRDALDAVSRDPPAFAIVDWRLGDGAGLEVVSALRGVREDARVIVLTGYASIPCAVAAVRAGAIDCLAKPAGADDLSKALLAPKGGRAAPPDCPLTPNEMRWAHIRQVFERCDRNVSTTARMLGMHRRTLQRILLREQPLWRKEGLEDVN